ncbi:hypothetical protein CYMTET_30981 [Cymbomonas tetramitiformis]|uniref:Uncharacterized protein n=1 Tax=Cymbomonas tetramitiformis TaxID=36881 RepID=A0AAE0FHR1_9CHLO|nr:hypothetical protein CYMTET_30981 [Cymbomonas tetramitiformis]
MEELRRQLAQKTDEVQQGRQQLLELKQFLKLTDRQLELKRQARAWRMSAMATPQTGASLTELQPQTPSLQSPLFSQPSPSESAFPRNTPATSPAMPRFAAGVDEAIRRTKMAAIPRSSFVMPLQHSYTDEQRTQTNPFK